IQFTPDLMPSDITGHAVLDVSAAGSNASGLGALRIRRGPVFTHLLLADEINRAPAKTQSALLEVMQEYQVTFEGQTMLLPRPFMVLATQNPLETEGTYPLPEAQLDRFLFKLRVRYPQIEELNAIIDRTTQARGATVDRVMTGAKVLAFRELIREVPIASHVRDLASTIIMATHPQWERAPEATRRFVRYGASPRGAQALVLGGKVRALAQGRYNVSAEDLKTLAAPALRHRIILNFEGEAEAVDIDVLVGQIVEAAEAVTVQGKEAFLR
ncbi:MAG: AAA family ATPase, partial [Candidatus Rokuibacteriota bacterium]